MRAGLIVNPRAGRGDGHGLGPGIERLLAAGGLPVTTWYSSAAGEVEKQVEAACRAGLDPVIVAGGDGSVYEALNGLMRAGGDARFGIIPVGTGNDFIKAARIPADWRAACERVLAGKVRRVDVGVCNGRHFANGVGAGFDADVARASRGIPWLQGAAVYHAAFVRSLIRGVRTPRATIELDGNVIEADITLVAVANGHCYGGAFHIAPGAAIDDGCFDVIVARALGRLGVLRFAPRVLAGTHLSLPIVRHSRARRVTITCAEGLCVHADGEIISETARRIEIEMLAQRLRLLV